MKLHWLIPITVDTAFQFTSKNELARAFKALGHDITTTAAYVSNKTPMDGFSSVEYIHTPAGSITSKIRFHWKMLNSILNTKADVVMFGFQAAHLIPFAWLFRLGKRRPKLIMDIRTVPVDIKQGFKGKIEVFRYKMSLIIANLFCDGITVITPMLGNTISPYTKRLDSHKGIWTSGVCLEHFERSGSNMRSQLALSGKQVLLYHGVLSPNRGLQNALYAFNLLKDKFPDLHFLFVGDGEGRSELEQISKNLKLTNRVIFTGKVPYEDVANYIRTADIAILPFPDITWWSVSSPIKLMEYLAIGIPIVATNIDAHKWVIEQTGGALLALDNSPESLARSIEDVLLYGIKQAELDILESTISWNKQAKSLLNFVQTL